MPGWQAAGGAREPRLAPRGQASTCLRCPPPVLAGQEVLPHLGSFLGGTQGSAVKAEDTARLPLLTLEQQRSQVRARAAAEALGSMCPQASQRVPRNRSTSALQGSAWPVTDVDTIPAAAGHTLAQGSLGATQSHCARAWPAPEWSLGQTETVPWVKEGCLPKVHLGSG